MKPEFSLRLSCFQKILRMCEVVTHVPERRFSQVHSAKCNRIDLIVMPSSNPKECLGDSAAAPIPLEIFPQSEFRSPPQDPLLKNNKADPDRDYSAPDPVHECAPHPYRNRLDFQVPVSLRSEKQRAYQKGGLSVSPCDHAGLSEQAKRKIVIRVEDGAYRERNGNGKLG
jgi:hypothetical protein